MPTSPLFEFDYMAEGQSGGEVLFNDSGNRNEALSQLVIQDSQTAPPVSPNNGEVWYVDGTGTGDWTGQDNKLALYYDGWLFATPFEGMWAWHVVDSEYQPFISSAWVSRTATDLATLLTALRDKGIIKT